jgi:hypothetical protein
VNPFRRSALLVLLLLLPVAAGSGDPASGANEEVEWARSYYPRFQAWNAFSDPGWVVFELMAKLGDLKEIASLDEEAYEARFRDDPGFRKLVSNLISSYENNCVVTGQVADGITGDDLGGVILSFETGSRTVRTSSANTGEYRLLYPCDGTEALVSTSRRGYYPAHRRVPLDGKVVGGRDLVLFPVLDDEGRRQGASPAPGAEPTGAAALVRDEAGPRARARPGTVGPGSLTVTLDRTEFPRRLEASTPFRVVVGWSVPGGEPDSGVVVVQGRCPGHPPQLVWLPRGGSGTGAAEFRFDPAATAADSVDVVVVARTLVSWPDGEVAEAEARLTQTYVREEP